jgi:putative photosynthetic complex assembly protein
MSEVHSNPQVPRVVLLGALGLVVLTIIGAAWSRHETVSMQQEIVFPAGEPVEQAELIFMDRPDGGLAVFRDGANRPVFTAQLGQDGFLRGVLRGFGRARKAVGVGPEPPLYLSRWPDGTLTLFDPSSSRLVKLNAFGVDNLAAFARLLASAERGAAS